MLQVLVEEGANLAFGQCAGELVHRLPANEQHDQRDAADAQRGRQVGRLVGVDLGQLEGAAVSFGQPFQHRPQRLARPAPGRPAVQQHGHLHRPLDDLGLEVGFGDVVDEAACGSGLLACHRGRAAVARGAVGSLGREGVGRVGGVHAAIVASPTRLAFGEVLHADQATKVRVLRPQLGAVELGGGVDQAVGQGQSVGGGGQGQCRVNRHHGAALHQ